MRSMRGQWVFLLALICTPLACGAASSNVPAGAAAANPTATSTPASPSATSAPQGQVESALPVEDPIFAFSTRALALERHVEMLQWQRDAQGAYATQWSAAQIDSSGFDQKHANPAELPFNGERWWTRDARLDGRPVSPDLLAALDAWRPYAPDLRQLPPNLAASFAFDNGGPDGQWLSTSQDPKNPAVGDVRLRWRILEHAAPPKGVVLRDGRWELPANFVAASSKPKVAPAAPASNGNWLQRTFGGHLLLLAILGVVLAVLILLWHRHHQTRH
jgi:hypothetical protein